MAGWRRLHDAEGPHATIIDLYAMVAARRGQQPHELALRERIRLARSVMPLVWPGFAVTAGTERVGDLIEVVAYDGRWPRRYDRWRDLLLRRLEDAAARIEHVGSTSVPGLPAKPTIDIQISVRELAAEDRYVPQLEAAGLPLRSRDDLHRYFRPLPGRPRGVHVHVCAAGSTWEREHLLFRDYLRAHPAARDRYAQVKREAAQLWYDDRWAYTDAKSEIILDLLDAAELWSAGEIPS